MIQNTPLQQETPVAVARLRPSSDFNGKYVLDNMRCWLKKENLDDKCQGGSEHTEALAVAIDALLLHYLERQLNTQDSSDMAIFEQAIRTKATLVSGTLLEQRGFQPVTELCKDMATHTSSISECLRKYADLTLQAPMKSSSQTVALQILSKLGLLDQTAEVEAAERQAKEESATNDSDDEEYDPWAGMKQYL